MTCGSRSRATTRASRRNRSRYTSSAAHGSPSTLSATSRSCSSSWACQTCPMPPWPSSRSSRYAPKRGPVELGSAPADTGQLAPQVGGGLRAAVQHLQQHPLVGRVDPVGGQPSAEEDQRRAELLDQVGLRPAAALLHEQHVVRG